ncbi:MAG: MarR family transcriptional regulator [Hydrococcus sp. RM1_1_31]|nr:MarR family transcriptional regulator [Hydrococcus sp. RM1_1_31]
MEQETQKYREWLEAIAANKDLRGEDLRVFLLLLANATHSSIALSQTEMASKLQVSKTRVSRAIKRLFLKGIITKNQFTRNPIVYRFSTQEIEPKA